MASEHGERALATASLSVTSKGSEKSTPSAQSSSTSQTSSRPAEALATIHDSTIIDAYHKKPSSPNPLSFQTRRPLKTGTRETQSTTKPVVKGPAPHIDRLPSTTYTQRSTTHRPSRPVVIERPTNQDIEVTSGSDEEDSSGVSSSSSSSDFDSDSDSSTTTDGGSRSGSRFVHTNNRTKDPRVVPRSRIYEVQLPRVKHGRGRRLILPLSTAIPLMTVTMRGDVQFVEQATKYVILFNLCVLLLVTN